MSTMWSTCSMSTGHCSTQAPHVVHDHSTSGSITPPSPTSGCAGDERSSAKSRRLITSSLGDNGLPVFQAGHCDWQRPHSVHVAKSSSPFQVKSSIAPRPTRSSSPGSSKSTGLPAEYTGSSAPSARGRRENATLNGAVKMCRCLECMTSTRNVSTMPIASSRPTVSMTAFAVSPNDFSTRATASETNAPLGNGK